MGVLPPPLSIQQEGMQALLPEKIASDREADVLSTIALRLYDSVLLKLSQLEQEIKDFPPGE
jgi:hypothetical protein